MLDAALTLSTTALFVPVCRSLLNVVDCPNGGTWQSFGSCFKGTHTSLLVIGILAAVLFALFLAVVVAVHCDRDPLSKSLVSRAHGRVDALCLMARLVLIAVTVMRKRTGTTGYLGVAAGIALLQLYSFLFYLPYHKLQVRAALRCRFCF